MACSELSVHLLEDHNFDTVFGIPSVHNAELYLGLPATQIRRITPCNEQSTDFVTTLNQANTDSAPVLLISSVNNSFPLGDDESHLHAIHDQRATINSLYAFSKTIWCLLNRPKVRAEVFNVSNGTQLHPAHIQIPVDAITAPGFKLLAQAYDARYVRFTTADRWWRACKQQRRQATQRSRKSGKRTPSLPNPINATTTTAKNGRELSC